MRSAGLTFCLCLIGGQLLTGCAGSGNDSPPRAAVSGTVTYQGKPVPFGNISFIPEAGSNLPVSGAKILEGHYLANLNGGVPVGKHQVAITAWSQVPQEKGAADVTDENSAVQILPPKYNVDSELKITVESTSPLEKNFDLK